MKLGLLSRLWEVRFSIQYITLAAVAEDSTTNTTTAEKELQLHFYLLCTFNFCEVSNSKC